MRKRAPGCLGCFLGVILPFVIGFSIYHFWKPYLTASVMEVIWVFFVAHLMISGCFHMRRPGDPSQIVRCMTLEPDSIWNGSSLLPSVYWPLNIGHDFTGELNAQEIRDKASETPGVLIDEESSVMFFPVKLSVKSSCNSNGEKEFMVLLTFVQGFDLIKISYDFAISACDPDSAGIPPTPK